MIISDFPSDIIISNVQLKHNTPVFYNESISLVGSSKDRGMHRIEGSFDVTMYTEASKRSFEAFLLKARGRLNTFKLPISTGRFVSSTVQSNPTLDGVHNIGSTSLILNAFSGSISAGDLFNVINDNKSYMALDDLTSFGTIEIYPPLRKLSPDNAQLNFVDPYVLIRLESDIQMIDYTESGNIHVCTLNFKEAL